MAKRNHVILYGFVESKPRIYQNEAGEILQARFVMDVIRRYTEVDGRALKVRHDHPTIIAFDKNMIKEIMELQTLDMVEVTGVLTTKMVSKKSECKNCHKENIELGMFGYITPLCIVKREACESLSEATKLLMRRNEISNRIEVLGTVCKEPLFHEENSFMTCQYPLATNRKYRIKEDDPASRTDYPWVKSFGDQAKRDAELVLGDTLFIDGSIQTRMAERKTVCKCCGAEYEWTEPVTEIYAYGVEYLFNNRGNKNLTLGTFLLCIPEDTELILFLNSLDSDDNGQFNNKSEIDEMLYDYEVIHVIPDGENTMIIVIKENKKTEKETNGEADEEAELYPDYIEE